MRFGFTASLATFGILAIVLQAQASDYSTLQTQAQQFSSVLSQDGLTESGALQDATDELSDQFYPTLATDKPVVLPEETQQFVIVTDGSSQVPLTDVPRSTWFGPYVRDVAEHGIVSGYRDAAGKLTGLYGPANNISIAELSKMAVKAASIDANGCKNALLNTAAVKSWAASYVACAEAGKWSVFADGTVDINRPATRAEVTVTILQAFGISFDGRKAPAAFRDVKDATPYAAAIGQATADGIVSGYTDSQGNPTGTFGPSNNINRAEVAKIISIALQKYGLH